MNKTIIGWTDYSWNCVIGCSRISDGCSHCYAERIALKYKMTPHSWSAKHAKENVILKPNKLQEPVGMKDPKLIFVNSMSDFFHEEIPDDFLLSMIETMKVADWHIYQILTKRPDRMVKFLRDKEPLPQCWWGVSVESKRHLDRIDRLREVESPIRFISFEPLLEPLGDINLDNIHWVIVGGESNPDGNYRNMDHSWAREIRDQCIERNMPFFFKQSSSRFTEQGIYLIEENGLKSIWRQMPGE